MGGAAGGQPTRKVSASEGRLRILQGSDCRPAYPASWRPLPEEAFSIVINQEGASQGMSTAVAERATV